MHLKIPLCIFLCPKDFEYGEGFGLFAFLKKAL